MPEVTCLQASTQRFNTSRADWEGLKAALTAADWQPLHGGTADEAATYFQEMLWLFLCTYIPYEEVVIKKKSHPWLNEKCETAIITKNAAQETDVFHEKSTEYHQTIIRKS